MPKVSTSFKPGQSGNPNGRPKAEWTFAGLLREAMEQKNLDGEEIKKAVMNALVDKAVQGDVQAIKEIANRLDGMPVQKNVLSGDEDHPLRADVHLAIETVYGTQSIPDKMPSDS